MTNTLVLEWTFEPPELFEERAEFQCDGYAFVIDAGRVSARREIEGELDDPAGTRAELQQRLDAIFLTAQVLEHQSYQLRSDNITLLRQDGSTGAFVIAESGTMKMTVGRADVQTTDAAGNVVYDSRRDRIELRRRLAQAAAIHIEDPVLDGILRSHSAAVNDPKNELVHLYEIREALAKELGSKDAARAALGISQSDWSRLGLLANDEPILQGRHRGKFLRGLRSAGDEELAEARAIARTMVEAYLTHISGP